MPDPPATSGASAPNVSKTPDGFVLSWLVPTEEDGGGHALRFSRWTGSK